MSRWSRPAVGRLFGDDESAVRGADPRAASRGTLRRRIRLRRLCASASAGVATWLLVGVALPVPPTGVPVLVAARDLGAGDQIQPADLRTSSVAPVLAAAGGTADPGSVVGQRLATPIGAGEPVTTTRLVPAGVLGRLAPGTRALHVPLPDAGLTTVLRAGDRVDVVATADGAGVAGDLVVLSVDAVPQGGQWGLGASGDGSSRGVLLAVPQGSVGAVVRAALGGGRASGVHLAIRTRG